MLAVDERHDRGTMPIVAVITSSQGLLRPIGMLGLPGTSLYQGRPLSRLVREFATDALEFKYS